MKAKNNKFSILTAHY